MTMADEGHVFTRQDATPATGPTSEPTAAVTPSGIPTEPTVTAPPGPAEPAAVAPTQEQINEWKQAFDNKHDWQRSNTQDAQRNARERDELKGTVQWANDLQYGYQNDPKVKQFVDEYNERFGTGQPSAPTGAAPIEGQPPQVAGDPALMQRIAASEQRLEQFERARDYDEAGRKYETARQQFQKITGRNWTHPEFQRLGADLARTGSIDPSAQMYATFHTEFAQAGTQQAATNVANAQAAAAGTQVEGVVGGTQTQPIDLRTASDGDIDRLARQAIGAEASPGYNKFIIQPKR
jgi:hypothetical protein